MNNQKHKKRLKQKNKNMSEKTQIKDENINLLEYGYNPEQTFELSANAILQIMLFAKQVAEKEEYMGFAHQYPKSEPKLHTTEDGSLEAVEMEFAVYESPTPFFNQQNQMFHSMLGVAALDLESKMQAIHLEHIKSGVATKIEEKNETETETPEFS